MPELFQHRFFTWIKKKGLNGPKGLKTTNSIYFTLNLRKSLLFPIILEINIKLSINVYL